MSADIRFPWQTPSVDSPDPGLTSPFAQIIDVGAVQALVDEFYALTGLPIALIDLDGIVVVGTGWQDVCVKFHREHPETLKNCLESDVVLTRGVARGEYKAYTCKNGLSDTVTPLYVNGAHVGNVFTGQFFYEEEEPDLEFFEQQADRYGFDRDEYLAAVSRAPRFSRATVDTLMRFYMRLADQIAKLSYSRQALSDALRLRDSSESTLREVARLHQHVVVSAHEGIVVCGPDLRYQMFNPFMERLTGLKAEEVIGKHPLETPPSVAHGAVVERMERALAGERPPPIEFHYQVNGTSGWALDTTTPLFDAGGAIVGVISTVQDITERRHAEEEQRRSEAHFRAIYEQSPLGIALVDYSRGCILEANPEFARITGRTVSELRSVDWLDITHSDDIPMQREKLAQMQAGEIEGFQLDKRYLRPDGSEVWINMIAAPTLVGERPLRGQLIMIADISERRAAEQALVESKLRLERLLKSITETMGKVVEARDPYTQGHEQGVARLCCLLGREMGLAQAEVDLIEMAALVHDIGKLSVPAEILSKPGKLSPLEFELVKHHSEMGFNILERIDFDGPVASIILQHHERVDGTGYPNGLKGDEIMLEARVIAVADVVEAMASHRPYRPALGLDAAVDEVTQNQDKFDPRVVQACVRLHRDGRLTL